MRQTMSRTPFRDLLPHQKEAINNTNKRWCKTIKGVLSRTYKNMRGRTEGIQKAKAHIYKGLYLLPREEFYLWSLADKAYQSLYEVWKNSNFDRKLTPSIDRIDASKGYEKGNIRWVTHSQNSASTRRWR